MPNTYFQFKQFTIHQDRSVMKVTTDACLFGAWAAREVGSQESGVGSMLDIGTGTGLLSLMVAQNSGAEIDAIEIDEESFQQAKENIAASKFEERIKVYHGDIKTFSLEKKYDVIISNPPFYENELKSGNLRKNIAHHQSGLLLDELFTIIKSNLSHPGIFFLLLPYKRYEEIRQFLFKQELEILKIILVRQSTKHDYFRIMISGKLKDGHEEGTIIDEISIWNDKQQYTDEFVELLKDYYLNL